MVSDTAPSRIVLIVDDSPEDRELYRRYLQRDQDYSYTILEASLGQEGLELWQQQRPDMVLLDYRLPDLDGLAFLAQLPSLAPQPCLPVIMMTDQSNEAIAVRAIKAGAQDYLVKQQITPEGLHLAVNGAIEAVWLRTQLQQRMERERVIAQMTQQMHRSLHLGDILQTVVTEVRQFLHTDRVLVFQLQSDGNGTIVAESVGSEWRSLLSTTIHDPCLAEHYLRSSRSGSITHDSEFVEDDVKRHRQGQVTAISDIHASDIDPCHVELLAQFQVNANLVVPILHDDLFWGLLIAHHCSAPRSWGNLEIDLLKELATQLSVALRQAELYEQAQHELTERRQVEATLKESEERLKRSLDATQTATWDWDISGKFVFCSPHMEALFGLQPGEFDGSYEMFMAIVYPDDREHVVAAIEHSLATGAAYHIEFRVVHPNSSVWWMLSQGKVFYDQNGEPIRMAGVAQDIMQRKHVELALRDSEERFRQLTENTNVVFWIKEKLEDRVSYVSPAYERLWGLDPQELYDIPLAWVDHIHPDDREGSFKAFQEKAAIGQFDEEYRLVLSDGSIRWVRDRCFPLRDGAGNVYRFAGIAEDITDRKQAELNQQFLSDLDWQLRQQADVEAMVWQVVSRLGAYLGVDRCLWHEIDWQQRAITVGRTWYSPDVPDVAGIYALDEFFSTEQLHQFEVGQPLIVNDVTTHPSTAAYAQNYLPLGATAFVSIPCIQAGRWVAVLAVNSRTLRLWRADEVALLQDIVVRLWSIIEQTRSLQALQEQEERTRLATEAVHLGMWFWDLVKEELIWTDRCKALFGLAPDVQMTYEVFLNALHPDDRDRTYAAVTRALEQKVEYDIEYRTLWSDDSVHWIAAKGRGFYDTHNQPVRMMGTAQDISDRKQTEEMVRHAAARDAFRISLTDELRSLDDPIEIQATTSRILGEYLDANRVAYFQVHGSDYVVEHDYVNGAEALRGGYPINSFGPRLLAAYRAGQVICAADVSTDPYLSPAQRSAYAAIQIAAYIGIPLVKNGEFVAGLAIHTTTPRVWTPEEVSLAAEVAERTWAAVERAHAEIALRASHATFRHLVDNSPFGVYVVDADFRLAQVSTGGQKAFENVRPLLGRDFAEVMRLLWLEPFASETIAHFRHTLATGEPYHAPSTVERRHDTDTVESYDWKIERIALPDGRSGVVCHFYDLSERQQLLQREQTARAEAEQANRIKDEFLAILSHELRSPLNPILGWARLLQTRQFDPAKTAEALATIERNAKLQTQLIDDLLDVAKILRGKLRLEMASVDLVFVIEAAIDTVRAAAVAKEILLHPVLPPIGRVSGDAARLQQIVWNLLSNAIKFTPAKGQVEVRLERAGNQAKITVSDTGKGINSDFLPHLFESFQQEDASTTRQYGGLGLGLAIVRHLVEAQGGTIQADSPGEGLGATFTVQLPLLDTESERTTSEAVSSDEIDLTGVRILAVDDEPDARALLAALLTQYGAEVLTVSSATEVLANLESFQPDVFISDIGMPEVDGYMLMQKIRALPPEKGGQILAIALTAYAREEDHQQAINKGYQRHLTKPLDLDQLVQAVVALTRQTTFEKTTSKARDVSSHLI